MHVDNLSTVDQVVAYGDIVVAVVLKQANNCYFRVNLLNMCDHGCFMDNVKYYQLKHLVHKRAFKLSKQKIMQPIELNDSMSFLCSFDALLIGIMQVAPISFAMDFIKNSYKIQSTCDLLNPSKTFFDIYDVVTFGASNSVERYYLLCMGSYEIKLDIHQIFCNIWIVNRINARAALEIGRHIGYLLCDTEY